MRKAIYFLQNLVSWLNWKCLYNFFITLFPDARDLQVFISVGAGLYAITDES